MTMPLVRVANLNKVYHSNAAPIHAVADLSISILVGEFVAICGRSGSGKSTLLHLLGLLARPDSGRYELNGVDVSGFNDADRAATRCASIGVIRRGKVTP
jgi:ABC-type lipoprotein export system ATPase subunit